MRLARHEWQCVLKNQREGLSLELSFPNTLSCFRVCKQASFQCLSVTVLRQEGSIFILSHMPKTHFKNVPHRKVTSIVTKRNYKLYLATNEYSVCFPIIFLADVSISLHRAWFNLQETFKMRLQNHRCTGVA